MIEHLRLLKSDLRGDSGQVGSPSSCQREVRNFRMRELLADFECFKDLGPGVRDRLPTIVHVESQQKDQVVFYQGDPPGRCYIVLSGEVAVWRFGEQQETEPEPANAGRRDSMGALSDSEESTCCPSEDSPERAAAQRSASQRRRSGQAAAVERPPASTPPPPSNMSRRRSAMALSAAALAIQTTRRMTRRTSLLSATDALGEDDGEDEGGSQVTATVAAAEPVRRQSQRRPTAGGAERRPSVLRRRQSHCGADDDGGLPGLAGLGTYGKNLATLGAGTIFGELALMNNSARSATITCLTDCDFLVIERTDFDLVLKSDMTKMRTEKVDFLKTHLPMKDVPEEKLDKVVYHFRKDLVPKGYCFLEQGVVAKECFYVMTKGSVEFRCDHLALGNRNAKVNASRTSLSALVEGGLFGSSALGQEEPFSVVATTRSEVLCVDGRAMRAMPLSLLQGVRQYVAQTTLWRLQRCEAEAAQAEKPSPTRGSGRSPLPGISFSHGAPSGSPSGSPSPHYSMFHALDPAAGHRPRTSISLRDLSRKWPPMKAGGGAPGGDGRSPGPSSPTSFRPHGRAAMHDPGATAGSGMDRSVSLPALPKASARP